MAELAEFDDMAGFEVLVQSLRVNLLMPLLASLPIPDELAALLGLSYILLILTTYS